MSVMKCERSVMVMTLHWHSFQISSLGNCVDDTPTETGLRAPLAQFFGMLHRQFHIKLCQTTFFFTSFKFKVIHETIHILPPPCEGMRWGYINDGVYINNESLYKLAV